MRVRYYRQSNKKLLILGFIELLDVLFLTPIISISVAFKSPDIAVVGLVLYIIYGVVFRMGKPPAYGYHFFKRRLIEPAGMKPGKTQPPYPYNNGEDDQKPVSQ